MTAFYDTFILGLNNFLLEVASTRGTRVSNKEIRKTITGGRNFNTEYLLMTAFQLERLHFPFQPRVKNKTNKSSPIQKAYQPSSPIAIKALQLQNFCEPPTENIEVVLTLEVVWCRVYVRVCVFYSFSIQCKHIYCNSLSVLYVVVVIMKRLCVNEAQFRWRTNASMHLHTL